MPLTPFLSLNPLNPSVFTYNAANPNAPYAYGRVEIFGGFTSYFFPRRLSDQNANNEIIVGFNPAAPANQSIASIENDVCRRSTISILFAGYNVTTRNQYLLLFALRGALGSPSAQFFVGANLVRTEPLSGDEQVAILLDCPGPGSWVYVYVRRASPASYAAMGFKGMDCYLL